jgi:hypothetical protein
MEAVIGGVYRDLTQEEADVWLFATLTPLFEESRQRLYEPSVRFEQCTWRASFQLRHWITKYDRHSVTGILPSRALCNMASDIWQTWLYATACGSSIAL